MPICHAHKVPNSPCLVPVTCQNSIANNTSLNVKSTVKTSKKQLNVLFDDKLILCFDMWYFSHFYEFSSQYHHEKKYNDTSHLYYTFSMLKLNIMLFDMFCETPCSILCQTNTCKCLCRVVQNSRTFSLCRVIIIT